MRLLSLIKKELIEIFRQPELVMIMLIVPILQIILLGYVISTDITHIPITVVNHSSLPESDHLIHQLQATPIFKIKKVLSSHTDYRKLLEKGDIKGVVLLNDPDQFPAVPVRFPEVTVLLDGTDSNIAVMTAGYISGMVKHATIKKINDLGIIVPFEIKTVIRFNPELKSIFYMGPGIVALILTILTGFLAVVSIVKEFEQQTMDVLLLSRLSPLEVYLGKVIPPALIGMAEMIMGVLLVVLWFKIPIRGGLIDLFIATVVFLPAILSYSLLISIFSTTQQQAMFFGWFSLVTFMLLAGFFTPLDNIPGGIRFLAHINPLRYFIQVIREIFLKGNGIIFFWKELLVMMSITVVTSSISIGIFYRRFVNK